MSGQELKITFLSRVFFHETFETPYLPAAVLAQDELQMEQPPGAAPGFPVARQDPGPLSLGISVTVGLQQPLV